MNDIRLEIFGVRRGYAELVAGRALFRNQCRGFVRPPTRPNLWRHHLTVRRVVRVP